MEKKDFYEYAKKCNLIIPPKSMEIEKMRDDRIKSAGAKMIEIANFIKDNSPLKMDFEVCLSQEFYKYDRNWANIFLPEQKIFIFICKDDFERDVIFQIWRGKHILIFDEDVDMDYVGSEIFRKMNEIKEMKELREAKEEKKRENTIKDNKKKTHRRHGRRF